MIVVDTSVVYALADRGDADHGRAVDWIGTVRTNLVTTPLAVAEMDHMISTLGGAEAAAALYEDLTSGVYLVEWWAGAMRDTIEVARRHSKLGLGLADCSLVALADHMSTTVIATLDERPFRLVKARNGAAFTILPADSR